jgi:hypothetical protein
MGILDDRPLVETNPDVERLVKVLTQHFWEQSTAVPVVKSIVDAGTIDWHGSMAEVWPRLVVAAAGVGRLREVVVRAADIVPAEPLFIRLIAEHTGGGSPAAADIDYWLTPRLWTTHAMIDRASVRQKLKSMQGADGQRALLVVGKKDTGTSHVRRYMTYLSEKGYLSRVFTIDNAIRAGTPISVLELAQWIAVMVVGDDAPKFDVAAQPDSIATQFRTWFSGVAARMADPVWLVFDNFTRDSASEAALKLIRDLATAAADNQLGTMRVTVCGYEGAAPAYPGAALEPTDHPTADDLKVFFREMSKVLTGQESGDEAIDLLVERFVADGGAIESRPITELGPSALAFASLVYSPVPA